MNTLIHVAAAPLTMSSREIAGLTGKRHDNVMGVCRSLKATGVCPEIQETPYHHAQNGQTYLECLLTKRDSLVLIARLSPEFTAQVVDRWQELEALQAQPRPAVPQSFAQALRLAAEQQEQIELQQAALEAARPKVTYAEAMLNADGTVLVRDAAKTIGVPVRKLEKALREKGVILPDNAPAARYVAQGYFKEALHHFETNTRGRQLSRVARVTGRGLEFLRRFVARHANLFASNSPKAAR
jgi:anti-repressor protein